MNSSKWNALMEHFQFENNINEFVNLTNMYGDKNRSYHNLNHVKDCFSKLDHLSELISIDKKPEIELAFWFHDVIYDPFRKDNESKSAKRAKSFLESQGADQDTIDFVDNLIMATIHKNPPKNISESYVMDIDISILGSDAETYRAYCENIRKEYRMVPGVLYKQNRAKIMKMFLNREQLYFTEFFKNKYEAQARANITNEIATLTGVA